MRIFVILGMVSTYGLVQLSGSTWLLQARQTVGNPLSSADGTSSILTAIIGGLVVFIFYWFKFDEWAGEGHAPAGFRPRPARHFTTWVRYMGWTCAYGLLMVGAYALLAFFPGFIYRLVDGWARAATHFGTPTGGMDRMSELLARLLQHDGASVIDIVPFAVMLTTIVWAGIRPFSEFERRFRLHMQERAAIPTQARELVETFRTEGGCFAPDKEVVVSVVDHLPAHLFEESDFAGCGEDRWRRYARVEYLHHLLNKYNREPLFSRLAERYRSEFQEFEARSDRLRRLVQQRVADVHESMIDLECSEQPEDDGAPSGLTFRRAEIRLRECGRQLSRVQTLYFSTQARELDALIDATWDDALQLVVLGVLAVSRSPMQRRELLQAFGLRLKDETPVDLDPVTVTLATAVAMAVIFVASAVYTGWGTGRASSAMIPKDMNEALYWSAAGCAMHVLAIGCGYWVQRSMDARRKRLLIGRRQLPSRRTQVAEAMWAGGFGISVNVLLLGALLAIPDAFGRRQFDRLVEYWWWAAVPGVTAFFTAFTVQQSRRSDPERTQWILLQGAATGLVAMVVFYAVHLADLTQQGLWEFQVYVAVTTVTLGLAFGAVIWEWVEGVRHAGLPERRTGRRRRSWRRGVWRDGSKEVQVRIASISHAGAELHWPEPISVGTEGRITLAKQRVRRGKVVRRDEEDLRRGFVQFLYDPA